MRYILVVICALIIFIHHFLVFNQLDYKTEDFLGEDFPIENSYVKYFWQKNENPTYVFNTPVMGAYSEKCYNEGKNCSVFVHQEMYAGFEWISSIQYIGTVVATQNAPYFYNMLDNITNISPYWEYPYSFGMLLVPISKFEPGVSDETKEESWKNAAKLGEKGIKYVCEDEKVNKILALEDGIFWDTVYNKGEIYEELKNPCNSDTLAQYLGFLYYHDLKDLENSIRLYKIAAFQEGVPNSIIGMVSVVSGVLGEHEKAIYMFLQKISAMTKQIENAETAEEVELYAGRKKNNENRLIVEVQFHLLNKSYDQECGHNYECLVKKGNVSKAIAEQWNVCLQNDKLKNIKELDDVFENIQDSNTLSELSTCIALSIGLSTGVEGEDGTFTPYISPDGNFLNAVNNDFTYFWDNDKGDWWMGER